MRPVEAVERHLDRIERVVMREDLQVDGRVLVPGEADEADLALALPRPVRWRSCRTGAGASRAAPVVIDAHEIEFVSEELAA